MTKFDSKYQINVMIYIDLRYILVIRSKIESISDYERTDNCFERYS